jgi:hypothetical protein
MPHLQISVASREPGPQYSKNAKSHDDGTGEAAIRCCRDGLSWLYEHLATRPSRDGLSGATSVQSCVMQTGIGGSIVTPPSDVRTACATHPHFINCLSLIFLSYAASVVGL